LVFKSIEIYYDIDNIPDISAVVARPGVPRWDEADRALDFRNEAIELIEHALVAADAGEWEAAQIGRGEVNFGFAVDDFDEAERIVRKTVAGTPFAGIREIVRSESGMADLAR